MCLGAYNITTGTGHVLIDYPSPSLALLRFRVMMVVDDSSLPLPGGGGGMVYKSMCLAHRRCQARSAGSPVSRCCLSEQFRVSQLDLPVDAVSPPPPSPSVLDLGHCNPPSLYSGKNTQES